MRTSVQNGTDDEIHNDGIDQDEIELTKCLNELDEKTNYQNMKKNAKKCPFMMKLSSQHI